MDKKNKENKVLSNVWRKNTKRSGRLSEYNSEKQDPSDRLFGQWSETAGNSYLVR